MDCGCPRPEDVEIVIDFIEKIGKIESAHREDCERDREGIMSSGWDESVKRLNLAKVRVEHKVRCRIAKIEEYRRFIDRFPYLKDAACRYL